MSIESISTIILVKPHPFLEMVEGMNTQQLKLICGEMTAQEVRTAKAVLWWAYMTARPQLEHEILISGWADNSFVELAKFLDIYRCIWHPDEAGIKNAGQLATILSSRVESQLLRLDSSETPYSQLLVDAFIDFLKDYIDCLALYPTSKIEVVTSKREVSEKFKDKLHWFPSVAAGRKARAMTAYCYPNKITLDKFVKEVDSSLKPFKENMEKLSLGNQELYAEEWMKKLVGWMEMESGGWD